MQKKIDYPKNNMLVLERSAGPEEYYLSHGKELNGGGFYGYDTIGPRVYALYHDGSKKMIRVRLQETKQVLIDETCPACGFPEMTMIIDAETARPLYEICTSLRGCHYQQESVSEE